MCSETSIPKLLLDDLVLLIVVLIVVGQLLGMLMERA